MRHYNQFSSILEQHPHNIYENLYSHPLVHGVDNARRQCSVSNETWKEWCIQVRDGFVRRNLPALPIELIPRRNGNMLHSFQIDVRCFVDHFNALSASYHILHTQKSYLEDNVSGLRRDVSTLCHRIASLEDTNKQLTTQSALFLFTTSATQEIYCMGPHIIIFINPHGAII